MKLKQLGANVAEVYMGGVVVLFSYETPVAVYLEGGIGGGWYVTGKKWSRTTSKHVKLWLRHHGVDEGDVKVRDQKWIEEVVGVRDGK